MNSTKKYRKTQNSSNKRKLPTKSTLRLQITVSQNKNKKTYNIYPWFAAQNIHWLRKIQLTVKLVDVSIKSVDTEALIRRFDGFDHEFVGELMQFQFAPQLEMTIRIRLDLRLHYLLSEKLLFLVEQKITWIPKLRREKNRIVDRNKGSMIQLRRRIWKKVCYNYLINHGS